MAYFQVDGIKFSANENITNWKHDSWWAFENINKLVPAPWTPHLILNLLLFLCARRFYEFGVFMVRWSHSLHIKDFCKLTFQKRTDNKGGLSGGGGVVSQLWGLLLVKDTLRIYFIYDKQSLSNDGMSAFGDI